MTRVLMLVAAAALVVLPALSNLAAAAPPAGQTVAQCKTSCNRYDSTGLTGRQAENVNGNKAACIKQCDEPAKAATSPAPVTPPAGANPSLPPPLTTPMPGNPSLRTPGATQACNAKCESDKNSCVSKLGPSLGNTQCIESLTVCQSKCAIGR